MRVNLQTFVRALIFTALAAPVLFGFSLPLAGPIIEAAGGQINPPLNLWMEIPLLFAYSLGLFAFPDRFWRRFFKFTVLVANYLICMTLFAKALTDGLVWLGWSPGLIGTVLVQACALVGCITLGYGIYRLSWPRLERYQPRFNPAGAQRRPGI
jgi:hypothetical protein